MANNEYIDIIARDRTEEGVASAERRLQGIRGTSVPIYVVSNAEEAVSLVKKGVASLKGTEATAKVRVEVQDQASPHIARIFHQMMQMPSLLQVQGEFNGESVIKGLQSMAAQGKTTADMMKYLNSAQSKYLGKVGKEKEYRSAGQLIKAAKEGLTLDKNLSSLDSKINRVLESAGRLKDAERDKFLMSPQFNQLLALRQRMDDARYQSTDMVRAVNTEASKIQDGLFRGLGGVLPNAGLISKYGVETQKQLEDAKKSLMGLATKSNNIGNDIVKSFSDGRGNAYSRLANILNERRSDLYKAYDSYNKKDAKHFGNIKTGVSVLNPKHVEETFAKMKSLNDEIKLLSKQYGYLGSDNLRKILAPLKDQLKYFDESIKSGGIGSFHSLANQTGAQAVKSQARAIANELSQGVSSKDLASLQNHAKQVMSNARDFIQRGLNNGLGGDTRFKELQTMFGSLEEQFKGGNLSRAFVDQVRDAVRAAKSEMVKNDPLQKSLKQSVRDYSRELNKLKDDKALSRTGIPQTQKELQGLIGSLKQLNARNDLSAKSKHSMAAPIEEQIKKNLSLLSLYKSIEEQIKRNAAELEKIAKLGIRTDAMSGVRGLYQKDISTLVEARRSGDLSVMKSAITESDFALKRNQRFREDAISEYKQSISYEREKTKELEKAAKEEVRKQKELQRAQEKSERETAKTQQRKERAIAIAQQKEMMRNQQAMNAAAKRYGQELDRINQRTGRHQGMLSQIGQELVAAYSVYQLRQFLTALIDIGGQFEYQRKSIANILGSTDKANTLFEKIKKKALHSPFSTLELDQYAKQLSAFDVQYHKLFDKLKKLSDISAGTGADMSRIILAYGHVKAEGFLTGMQRRQFSNANINVVGALSDLYSKQEQRKVSKREVYKLISEKQVSAEDLDKVLMAMAEPGGKFYEMQEAMAGTTKAMWKNVGDAINHMYMDLEARNRGELQGVAKFFMEASTYAKDFLPSLKQLILLLGAAKVATLAFGSSSSSAFAKYNSKIQREAAIMSTMQGVATPKVGGDRSLFGRHVPTHDEYMLASRGGFLDKKAAMREAYMNRMSIDTASKLKDAKGNLLFNKTEVENIERMNAGLAKKGVLMRNLTLGWRSVRLGITMAGQAVKGFLASFAPMIAVSLALEGIFYLINKNSNEAAEKKQRIDDLKDSYLSLAEAMKQIGEINVDELSDGEAYDHMMNLVDILRNEAPELEGLVNKIFAVNENGEFTKSVKERISDIRALLEEYKAAKKIATDRKYDLGGIVEDAVTDGIGYDELRNNVRDFDAEYSKYIKSFSGLVDYQEDYKQWVENIAKKESAYREHLIKIGAMNKEGKVLDLNVALENAIGFNEVLSPLLKESDRLYNKYQSSDISNFRWSLKDVIQAGERIDKVYPGVLKNVGKEFRKLPEYGKMSKNSMDDMVNTNVWSWLDKNLDIANKKLLMLKLGFEAAGKAQEELFNGESDADISDLASVLNKEETLSKAKLNGRFRINDTNLEAISKMKSLVKERREEIKQLKGVKNERAKEDLKKKEEELNALIATAKKYGIDVTEKASGSDSNQNKSDKALRKWQKETDAIKAFIDAFIKLREAKRESFKSDEQLLAEMKNMQEYKQVIKDLEGLGFRLTEFIKAEDVLNFLRKRSSAGIPNGANMDKEARMKALSSLNDWIVGQDLKVSKDAIEKSAKEAEQYFQKKIAEWDLYVELRNLTGNDVDSRAIAQSDTRVYDDVSLRLLSRLGSDIRFSDKNFEENVIPEFNKKRKIDHEKRLSQAKREEEIAFLTDNKPKDISIQDIIDAKLTLAEAEELFDGTENKFYKMYQQVFEHIQKSSIDFKKNMANAISETMTSAKKLEKIRFERKQKLSEIPQKDGKPLPEFQPGYDAIVEKYDREEQQVLDALFQESGKFMNATKDLARLTTAEIQSVRESAKTLLNLINLNKEEVVRDGKVVGYNVGNVKPDGTRTFISKESFDRLNSSFESTGDKGDIWKRKSKEAKSFERVSSWIRGKEYDNGTGEKKKLGFGDVVEDISALSDMAKNAFAQFTDMWSALGASDDAIDALNLAQEGLSGLTSIAQGFAQGGIVGGIVASIGAIAGFIGAMAKTHDKKLDRAIQRSKNRVNDLKYEYEQLQEKVSEGFGVQDEESVQSLEALEKQQAELKKQADLERRKKKKDAEAIKAYEREEAEVAKKIKNHARDRAKELYGIDLKDWSKRLSEALTEAFLNGEDAALRWRQTVGDMVRDVLKRMILLKTIEPLMKNIQDDFFDEKGKYYVGKQLENLNEDLLFERLNGIIDSPVLTKVSNLVSNAMSKFPESSKDSNSGTLGRLESGITEQTGSLLASYVNAIRSDVSLHNTIAKQQLNSLNIIVENTKRNADATEAIQGLFRDVTTGTKKLYVK